MFDGLTFVVLSLATWRISSLLVAEDGPFHIFRRLRCYWRAGEFGGATYDPQRLTPQEIECAIARMAEPQPFLGQVLSCLWCTSVWVALGLTLITALAPWSLWLWTPLALSAAAIAVERWSGGLHAS